MKKINKRKQRLKIKKRRKYIFILSIILLLVLTNISVKAGSKDSTLTRNVVDGYYAITTLDDGKHLYNLEINKVGNQIVYCIELGKRINNTIYDSTTNLSQSNLSDDVLNYVRKAMYYGYKYTGHESVKYYMATQELIWEKVSGREVYWTEEYTIDGAPLNIDSYKNEIITLINRHDNLPSFSGNVYQYLPGSKVILYDTKGVINDCEIISNGNQSYKIASGRLIVETNKNEMQKDVISVRRKNFYQNDSVLYQTSNSQTLMSPGKLTMPTATVTIETVGSTLTVNLVDKETKEQKSRGQATLTGAKYALYDESDKFITSFETIEGEVTKIENLLPKKYYIKQLLASKGYIIDEQKIPVTINDFNHYITLEEEIIKRKIEILKIYGDKDKNEYQSEKGILFNIYDDNLNQIDVIKTNDIGYANIDLLYGNYIIKQENTTPGYQKVKDINVSITEPNNEPIRYNLYDDQVKVKININTIDKESNKKIIDSCMKYKLRNKATNEYVSFNNEEIFNTDEKGDVLIPVLLSYGTYELEQITPPSKYLKNKEKLEVIINESSPVVINNDNELILNVEYLNIIIKGQAHITISKEKFNISDNSYSISKEQVGNENLILYSKENIITPYNQEIYKKDEQVASITTSDTSSVDTPILFLGEYCLKNEQLFKEDHCFLFENIDSQADVINKDINITIPISKYNVEIANFDKKNNNAIDKTILELYTISNKLINTSITNEEGVIKLSNLIPGKYYFKQKEINKNYYLNKELLYFEIEDKDIKLIMYNNKIKENKPANIPLNRIEIPNTLSNKNYIIEKISLLLILIGIIIYEYKKKYN